MKRCNYGLCRGATLGLLCVALLLSAQPADAGLGETREQLISHFGEPRTEKEFWFQADEKGKEGKDVEEWKWVAFPWHESFSPDLGDIKVPGVAYLTFYKNKVQILAALRGDACVAIEYKGDQYDRKMAPGPDSLVPELLKQSAGNSSWPADGISKLWHGDRVVRTDGRAFLLNLSYETGRGAWLLICDSSWPKLLEDALSRAKKDAQASKKRAVDSFYNAPPEPTKEPQSPTFAVKVIQKVDESETGLLCLQIGLDKVIFVTGYPNAADIADGDQLIFRGDPAGTYSYVTTQGSQATVRKIRWTGEAR